MPGFSFVAFPKFIVTWPIILMSFLLPALKSMNVLSEQLMTECWVAALIFVVFTLGFDFTGLWMTIIFLVCAFIAVSMMLITVSYEVPIFETIRKIIDGLQFSISSDTLLGIGFVLGCAYLGMIIVCNLNHRWVVTSGKLEREKFLLRSKIEHEISPRRPVNYELLDVLEYILTLGGGHLKLKLDDHHEKFIGLVLFVKSVDDEIDKYENTPTS